MKSRHVDALLPTIGVTAWPAVVERLLERGLIAKEKNRVLGIFRMTMLLATGTSQSSRSAAAFARCWSMATPARPR